MTDPKNEVASNHGEGDIEAKSMLEGEQGEKTPAAPAPPPGVDIPAAGTTGTDIARNLREKAERATKS